MTFDSFNLDSKILQAIAKMGYSTPTKIQMQAIPEVLKGSDLRASAQTGTGKTAAFLLPALNRLATSTSNGKGGPRILILVPTRELAMQISTQAEKYSMYMKRLKTVCIVGGVPYPAQIRQLSRPYEILIATPGRLIDFIERGKIDLSSVEILVLDEADRMLDMGFVEPVEQIVAETPPSRQTLLFSATLHKSVIKLSERLLNNPMEIIIQPEAAKSGNIKQSLHYADDLHHKTRLLKHILSQDAVKHAIVFTATKRHADQLTKDLYEKEYRVAALHGGMNQRKRTKTLEQLRNGKIKILVATDVAGRGIDVQSITHVINFDLPNCVEDYVHRIGRTGRAGAKGTALSLVSGRDTMLVKKIEAFTKQKIDVVEIAGFEPRAKPNFSKFVEKPRSNWGGNKKFKPPAKAQKPRGPKQRGAKHY